MSSLNAISSPPTIYLDYAASTPSDPKVLEVMNEVARNVFANPTSDHAAGRAASRIVEESREKIANEINAIPSELVFTSGATESNNLAIQGIARYAELHGISKKRIVCSAIEHSSVLEPARFLKRYGFDVVLAPVDRSGTIHLDELRHLITDETLLVCVQLVNNEIGTIQPISEVTELAHSRTALVHCDAAQALGKIPVDVGELGADFVSFSAHKCYGPKGVGALWICGGVRNSPIEPLSLGGGHEGGLRPGTLNTPCIAGFAKAVEIGSEVLYTEAVKIRKLRDHLETQIRLADPGVIVNGFCANRVPNLTSLTVSNIHNESFSRYLRQLDISRGSACQYNTNLPSHVLRAIGLSEESIFKTIRFSLGRYSEIWDVERATEPLVKAIEGAVVDCRPHSSNLGD